MENENDIVAKRSEAVEELRAAFAELESGEGLTRFVGGHGIQSQVFEFEWSEPSLGISFRLPYARVLSDEESQKADEEEIGAAIRMAILLLTVEGQRSKVKGRASRFLATTGVRRMRFIQQMGNLRIRARTGRRSSNVLRPNSPTALQSRFPSSGRKHI